MREIELLHANDVRRRVVLRNPRIVAFCAAETSLPAAVRPVFRAMHLPGYVLLEHHADTGNRASRPKP